MGAARKTVDWEAVEREYRAGIRSLRDIAAEFDITDTAIRKRAKRDDWVRDLSAKVSAKAEAMVRRSEVRSEVRSESAITERELVEANAEMMANVIRSHRQSLGRLGSVVQLLFDRLETELTGTELFEQLGELMHAPDENGQDKLNELYRKVIALPSQTDTAKKLAETLKTKIELERKVFKIEEQPPINPALSCMSVEFVNPPAYQDDE